MVVFHEMKYPEANGAIQRITDLARTVTPLVVAIDGRSGTGKSTLAEHIAWEVGATIIDQDDFYSGGSLEDWRKLTPSEKVDRVIDWRCVRAEVLEPLRAGKVATWHPFDWESMAGGSAVSISAEPSSIVMLDGAYSSRRELADLIDLSILVVLPESGRGRDGCSCVKARSSSPNGRPSGMKRKRTILECSGRRTSLTS